jgi:hypothetical protein
MFNADFTIKTYKSIIFFLTLATIVGNVMLYYYLNSIKKNEDCSKINPKQAAFLSNYNWFMFISSCGIIILTWMGLL